MQVTVPPLRFDHPYDGPVIERILPLEEVRKLCIYIGVRPADGCAGYVTMSDGTKACFIVLPTDGPDPDLDRYRRHETAHCNGWPANHLDK
jgi:hypothetical protein